MFSFRSYNDYDYDSRHYPTSGQHVNKQSSSRTTSSTLRAERSPVVSPIQEEQDFTQIILGWRLSAVRDAHHAAAGRGFQLQDLLSRINWGVSYPLLALGDEDEILLLQQTTKRRGFNLPLDVARYLLAHYPRDMRTQLSILEKLNLFRCKKSIRSPCLLQNRNCLDDKVTLITAAESQNMFMIIFLVNRGAKSNFPDKIAA